MPGLLSHASPQPRRYRVEIIRDDVVVVQFETMATDPKVISIPPGFEDCTMQITGIQGGGKGG